MTIRLKLRLVVLFPIIFGCFIVFFEMRTVQTVDDVLNREKIAGQVLFGSSDLSRLSNDYIQKGANDRIRQQWTTTHRSLAALLEDNLAWNTEQKKIIDDLNRSNLSLGEMFAKLSAIAVSSDGAFSRSAKHRQSRWARQISTKTEFMRTSAQQLAELLRNEIRETQNRAFRFSIFSSVVVIVGVAIILFLLGKSIVNALAVLRNDTEVIGTGNFDHSVSTDGKDEIGDLSRAFDDMIMQLKSVTASRDQLNEEIRSREQAEEVRDQAENVRELAEKEAEAALLELEAKLDELEKFNKLAVNRELRMIELKREINDLLESIGRGSKYEIVE